MQDFIEKVLKRELAFNVPTIDNNDGFFFEMGDEERSPDITHQLLATAIATLPGGGLAHGVTADVTDDTQNLSESATGRSE